MRLRHADVACVIVVLVVVGIAARAGTRPAERFALDPTQTVLRVRYNFCLGVNLWCTVRGGADDAEICTTFGRGMNKLSWLPHPAWVALLQGLETNGLWDMSDEPVDDVHERPNCVIAVTCGDARYVRRFAAPIRRDHPYGYGGEPAPEPPAAENLRTMQWLFGELHNLGHLADAGDMLTAVTREIDARLERFNRLRAGARSSHVPSAVDLGSYEP